MSLVVVVSVGEEGTSLEGVDELLLLLLSSLLPCLLEKIVQELSTRHLLPWDALEKLV